jgi:uncharacterized SAM-binding protein YcdF (DUF218 family)
MKLLWALWQTLLTLALLYGIGLAVFVGALPAPFTTVPAQVQGLAVFTGGSGRVATALTLIQQGFTGPVLISGRHPSSSLADMLELAPGAPQLSGKQKAQVSLDAAQSTHENMLALQQWATNRQLRQVGVITSTYHVARVRLLHLWLAPQVGLTLLPVQPEDTSFKTLLREYHKLLAFWWLQ